MKNIGIIFGGFSSEFEISKKSALNIYNAIDRNQFKPHLIQLDHEGFHCVYQDSSMKLKVDLNDFSFDANGKIKIDCAIITIHGTPGEDGKLQGYLDIINLPYINSSVLASSLSFNKWFCNKTLNAFGIRISPSLVIRKDDTYSEQDIIKKLGLPIFVKPTNAGSSYGISKVSAKDKLQQAIQFGFEEGDELILEAFVSGRELTCGVIKENNEVRALPITEIITNNEFFDFDAKYEGDSNEITPADIPSELKEKIQNLSREVYKILQLSGIARIDFIEMNGEPVLIEVNTTPGMSDASIVPQMVEADNRKLQDVFTELIKEKI